MPKIDVFLRGSLKNRCLMTKGGGSQKSLKIDEVFNEYRLSLKRIFKTKLYDKNLCFASLHSLEPLNCGG